MSNRFAEMIQPESLRSPEVIIGAEWDTKTDIWNVGCLVSELFLKFHSDTRFERIRYQPRYTNLHEDLNYSTHTGTMRNLEWIHRRPMWLKLQVYLVISLPNFWTEARSRSVSLMVKVSQFLYLIHLVQWFQSGSLLRGAGRYSITLKDLLSRAGHSPEVVRELADILSSMLIIDPNERWSAAQLLNHPWLKNVE